MSSGESGNANREFTYEDKVRTQHEPEGSPSHRNVHANYFAG